MTSSPIGIKNGVSMCFFVQPKHDFTYLNAQREKHDFIVLNLRWTGVKFNENTTHSNSKSTNSQCLKFVGMHD